MRILIQIDEFIARVVRVIIGLLLFAIMTLLFIAVIARYFLNSPIIWIDELVTYFLVGMTFLGGYVALRSEKLVRVTFALSLLPDKARRVVEIFSQICISVFLCVIGYYSILMLSSPVALSQKTVALRMPMIIFYTLVPIMVALMLMRMVINIYNLYRDSKAEDPGKEGTA